MDAITDSTSRFRLSQQGGTPSRLSREPEEPTRWTRAVPSGRGKHSDRVEVGSPEFSGSQADFTLLEKLKSFQNIPVGQRVDLWNSAAKQNTTFPVARKKILRELVATLGLLPRGTLPARTELQHVLAQADTLVEHYNIEKSIDRLFHRLPTRDQKDLYRCTLLDHIENAPPDIKDTVAHICIRQNRNKLHRNEIDAEAVNAKIYKFYSVSQPPILDYLFDFDETIPHSSITADRQDIPGQGLIYNVRGRVSDRSIIT